MWSLLKVIGAAVGKDIDVPMYSELIQPQKRDTRTAEQIKQDIVEKLTGRR